MFGKGWTGRGEGNLSINFADDRRLSVFNTIRLWMIYIEKCFRGTTGPREDRRMNKEIDYATAIYYIMTAEDGQTIIFFSKVFGAFPSQLNSSALAGELKTPLFNPEFTVNFAYSMKKDDDPKAMAEFNMIAGAGSSSDYMPIYNPKYATVNTTFVGTPFIAEQTGSDGRTVYLLRFRPRTDNKELGIDSDTLFKTQV
jgi:hypothetical protein